MQDSIINQSFFFFFLGRNIKTRFDVVRSISGSPKNNGHYSICLSEASCHTVYFISGNSRMDKFLKLSRDLHYEINYASKRIKRHINQISTGPALINHRTNAF